MVSRIERETIGAFYPRSDPDYVFTPRETVGGISVDILVGNNRNGQLVGLAVGVDDTIYARVEVPPSTGREDGRNFIDWLARRDMAQQLIVQLNR